MLRTLGTARLLKCALALLLATGMSLAFSVRSVAADANADAGPELIPTPQEPQPATGDAVTNGEISSRPVDQATDVLPEDVTRLDHSLFEEGLPEYYDEAWSWHWVPVGLIYHSYLAGPNEPRMGLNAFTNLDGRSLWDATLGGRVGFVQYGNGDPVHPVGYQLDFYGAAIARLDVENQQDLDSTDYVFGFPFTWGDEQWQWKLGYAHLSSHLGDEYAISNPGSLANRINYVRDSIVLGTSYFVVPAWRVYGEVGWAFHASGGAEPFDTQFGTEVSQAGPTGDHWVPFTAVNCRVRQDQDFTGDITLQCGWLRRNILEQTLRIGAQYYNGKSSQFQFANINEQQLGVGLWYDF
jgi:hypothetical protein